MNPLGDMLSLFAALSWAIYSLVLRRLNALYSVMFISRKTFFYGVVTAIPFMLLEPRETTIDIITRPEVLGNLLFLGLIASMGAYVIWAQAIRYLGAIKASNYLYFQPIITLIASVLLIGEQITAVGYIGCGFILLGVWLGDKLSRNNV
jgi:drug/metabolite transporter (DMT)-like permease